MKMLFAALLSLFVVTVEGFSATESAKTPKVSFQSEVLSRYVDTDGYILHDRPVVQSSLVFSLPKDFYIYIWNSTGLDGKRSSGNEGEYGIGWYKEGEAGTIDILLSYNDLDRMFDGPKNDLFIAYAKLSKSFTYDVYGSLKPLLELAHFSAGPKSDFEGGFRGRAGVEYSHKLFGSKLVYEVSLMRDNGTFGTIPAWILRHEIAFDWKVGGATVRAPSICARVPVSSGDPDRETSVVYGVRVAFDF